MNEGYGFGIEEEYFLADADTCGAACLEKLDRFHAAAAKHEVAEHELLKGQVEVASSPGENLDDARSQLADLRGELSSMAIDHGLCLFAAGTYPDRSWRCRPVGFSSWT